MVACNRQTDRQTVPVPCTSSVMVVCNRQTDRQTDRASTLYVQCNGGTARSLAVGRGADVVA